MSHSAASLHTSEAPSYADVQNRMVPVSSKEESTSVALRKMKPPAFDETSLVWFKDARLCRFFGFHMQSRLSGEITYFL